MRILIKNGHIITAYNEFDGDIVVEDEKIAGIAARLDVNADRVIDAAGKYILPGGVDQHTHFSALCNSGDKDTAGYETTKAVIVGGTTTIIDYAPQDPGKGLIESAHHRINVRAKGKTCVDFSLHALITEVYDGIINEIGSFVQNGISSIKCFMAYNGSPLHVDDGTLYKVLKESKNHGITVFVHAENGEIIDTLQQDCVKKGQLEPKYHAVSRPPFVEGEATKRAIEIAKAADAPLYVVHITCKEAVDAVQEAQGKGLPVMGETCTHYLTTTKEVLEDPVFERAARFICSPALRDRMHQDALWKALQNDVLNAVASDHCGIDMTMKRQGLDNFTLIPNGSPGAADRIPVLWTYGVMGNRISKQRFVQIASTNPAKINGIYPRKGHIGIGADADIIIFDPEYKGIIKWSDNPNGVDYNVYEGTEVSGRPETVFLRGRVVVEEGQFIGELGQGQYIPAKPFAAAYKGV